MFFKKAVEVIPFKTFMATKAVSSVSSATAGSMYYSSDYLLGGDVTNMLDFGLIFFIGLGIVLLGVTFLESRGISINKNLIKYFLVVVAGVGLLYSIFSNDFFKHLVMGW